MAAFGPNTAIEGLALMWLYVLVLVYTILIFVCLWAITNNDPIRHWTKKHWLVYPVLSLLWPMVVITTATSAVLDWSDGYSK